MEDCLEECKVSILKLWSKWILIFFSVVSRGHSHWKWHRLTKVPRHKEFAFNQWNGSLDLRRLFNGRAWSQTGSGSSSRSVRHVHHASVTWHANSSFERNSLASLLSLGSSSNAISCDAIFFLGGSTSDEVDWIGFEDITSKVSFRKSITRDSWPTILCTMTDIRGLWRMTGEVFIPLSSVPGRKSFGFLTSHPNSTACDCHLWSSIKHLIASSMFCSLRHRSLASLSCFSLQMTTNLLSRLRDARPRVWTSARSVATPSKRMTRLHSGTSSPSSKTLVQIRSLHIPFLNSFNSLSCSSFHVIPS